MNNKVIPIPLKMPFNLGYVNSYLIQNTQGFILIDSGTSNSQSELEARIKSVGCNPGELNLIIITHGDFDHIGNAAYIRNIFDSKIAMHPNDAEMAEKGDMFAGREAGNFLIRKLSPLLMGFGKARRFTPDINLSEDSDLNPYGLDAKILHLPGHSKGSIGILTSEGDLFCGDLLDNNEQPAKTTLVDIAQQLDASVDKLNHFKIRMIYPGHGKSFTLTAFEEKSLIDNDQSS